MNDEVLGELRPSKLYHFLCLKTEREPSGNMSRHK